MTLFYAAVPKVVTENKHLSNLNSMIGKMNSCRWDVPIELVHSPEQVFRARVAARENIERIKASFLRTLCPFQLYGRRFFACPVLASAEAKLPPAHLLVREPTLE